MSEPELPLTGARVTLREPSPQDEDSIVRLLTDPAVRRFLGGPRDAEATRMAVLAHVATASPDPAHPVVADNQTNRYMREVDLSRRELARPGHTQPEGGELELSYGFLPEHWGRGFAEEAARLLLHSFASCLPNQDVLVVTQTANVTSIRLAERLGFSNVDIFQEFDAEQWLGAARLASFR